MYIRICARKEMLFCLFSCSERAADEPEMTMLEVNGVSFYEWMLSRYAGKDSPRGDLTGDMKRSGDFPNTCDRAAILNYLDGKFACDEAIEVFKRAYRDYQRTMVQCG